MTDRKLTIRERIEIIERCKIQDKNLRKKANMYREELCEQYDLCPVTLSNSLRDKHLPYGDNCRKISEAYEKEVPWDSLTDEEKAIEV